jgi:hypothetical protein
MVSGDKAPAPLPLQPAKKQHTPAREVFLRWRVFYVAWTSETE